jgi:Holliday junction resolvase-like predicted endonuclease
LNWCDGKGEIDFTIFNSSNNDIIAFVECKSRLFDAAEAFR